MVSKIIYVKCIISLGFECDPGYRNTLLVNDTVLASIDDAIEDTSILLDEGCRNYGNLGMRQQ